MNGPDADGLILTEVAVLDLTQDGIQFIELQLLQVQGTEKRGGKGAELLGRFGQPVQHGVGGDLEDAGRGADTQALRQTGQDPHDAFDLGVFAVEDRAVVSKK